MFFFLMSYIYRYEEPVYIIEVLKQLMKSMRKKKHPHGESIPSDISVSLQ